MTDKQQYNTIALEILDAVAVVRLSRPKALNALNSEVRSLSIAHNASTACARFALGLQLCTGCHVLSGQTRALCSGLLLVGTTGSIPVVRTYMYQCATVRIVLR